MKRIYEGKTKDVYALSEGTVRLKFKDDMTGEDGVFDPGANTVGLSVEGMGKGNLEVTTMFFEIMNRAGVPTHFIRSDIENVTMDVKAATPFGHGVEMICRYKAVGSFLRRYGAYVNEGDNLDEYVEATLKDDLRGDPLITAEGLEALDIMTAAQFSEIKDRTRMITSLISETLRGKGLELYDIKLEFGKDVDGQVMLIDEISAGNMRVYKDGSALEPMELTAILLAK